MNRNSSVKSFFNDYALDFDSLYDGDQGFGRQIVNRIFRSSMRLRFEKTLAICHPLSGRSVVDVGCGPGHYALAFAACGAKRVVGVEIAEAMIEIALKRATNSNLNDICHFEACDIFDFTSDGRFDYAVVMGVMDYIEKPHDLIAKVMELTSRVAVFSFPAADDLLAWQRRLRYRFRCPLFMYREPELRALFEDVGTKDVTIERLARDYFVTVRKDPSNGDAGS